MFSFESYTATVRKEGQVVVIVCNQPLHALVLMNSMANSDTMGEEKLLVRLAGLYIE